MNLLTMKKVSVRLLVSSLLLGMLALSTNAQTTELTYQGQLQNSSQPANGTFDFEFLLFGTIDGGSQIGSTIVRNGIAVVNGIFTVNLNFGSDFTGAGRFLEIRVRQSGTGVFIALLPRQPFTSTPYSIKSLTADSAANATTASIAMNAGTAANFSGSLSGDVVGAQTATTVSRIQSRSVSSTPPLDGQVLKYSGVSSQWVPAADIAGSGGGGTITGVTAGTGLSGGGATGNVTLNVANGGVGTGQLADMSVTDAKIASVSGAKVTGTVSNAATATNATELAGVAASQYLQATGTGSGLTSLNASSITTGTLANARLGQIGNSNIADLAVTGPKIAASSVVKSVNSLTDNVTLAAGSNITITPSGSTLTFATTTAAVNAILNQTTQQAGANFNVSGDGTAGGTLSGNVVNAATQYNIAGNRVFSVGGSLSVFAGPGVGNPSGSFRNSYYGAFAGETTQGTIGNSFFGSSSGKRTTSGFYNSFFGDVSGLENTTGSFNTYLGAFTGRASVTGSRNTLIGAESDFGSGALVNASAIGSNAFVTQNNSLVLGGIIGVNGATASTSVGIGVTAPQGGLQVERDWNGSFGSLTLSGDRPTIRFSGGAVSGNNQWILHLGSAAGSVPSGSLSFFHGGIAGIAYGLPVFSITPVGTVVVANLGSAGGTQVCRNASNELASCSSSMRYKGNVSSFAGGLDIVKRLRPIAFTWNQDGMIDIGLGAEQVNQIEPLLTTTNAKGEVEGVKYDRISIVLLNAVNEQQAQIERLQKVIERQNEKLFLLSKSVCSITPKANVCKKD